MHKMFKAAKGTSSVSYSSQGIIVPQCQCYMDMLCEAAPA